jgi:hypothetical protein
MRVSDESYYRPVRARARINVQQRNAIDRFNRIGDLPNNILISSLRKIRHTLDEFLHTQDREIITTLTTLSKVIAFSFRERIALCNNGNTVKHADYHRETFEARVFATSSDRRRNETQ